MRTRMDVLADLLLRILTRIEQAEYRGDNGEQPIPKSGAKEEFRTLTGVTPPEPESGGRGLVACSYASLGRQPWTQKDTFGQGFGEAPETIWTVSP